MKLNISFDFTQIAQALEVARLTAEYADTLKIGNLLLYTSGIEAVRIFRKEFPDKKIMVNARLVDRVEEAITLFANAGANSVSVLAGASNAIIQHATTVASRYQMGIVLDLIDASSPGQSALDADQLEIQTILFEKDHDSQGAVDLIEQWQSVRDNTKLPIFISGKIDRSNVKEILTLKPQGIMVGDAITLSSNPAEEAAYFKSLLSEQ